MIAVLVRWQVWDPQKGCFFVGLKPTANFHRGLRVYEDAFGRLIAIRGAA